MNDSAKMYVFLHKALVNKSFDKGGKAPANLIDSTGSGAVTHSRGSAENFCGYWKPLTRSLAIGPS